MRLPETFRITVTQFGVKIFDPVEKRMMWISKPTFSTLFMGAKSVEIKNIPMNCVRAKVMDTGRGRSFAFAMAYKESREKVIWSEDGRRGNTYKSVEIPVPHTLWIVRQTDNKNEMVQIYAIKDYPVDAGKELTLYHFPFPNSSNSMTCYGGNEFHKVKIEELLPLFYGAPFTQELIHKNVRNFTDTWDCFKKLKNYDAFPYDCLVGAGTFASNWGRLTKGDNDE